MSVGPDPAGARNAGNSSGKMSCSPTWNHGSAANSSSIDRARNAAEPALRQQAQLIVVVADDPPVSCHPEILEQHVAGENVGRGEVLDGVAVVEHRSRAAVAGIPEKDVERRDAALGVDVSHDDPVPDDAHRSAGDAKQVLEQVIGEAAARELEVLELLRVGETPHPVADEHEMVLLHDRLTRRVLGRGELVLDDLEDQVDEGSVKTAITIPSSPSAKANRASGSLQVRHEAPEQLGLAVLVEPMALYSSSMRLKGMIVRRNSIRSRGRGTSTRKYDQLNPKTTLARSWLSSAASTTMPRSARRSGITSGSVTRPRRTRPTR